jgi:deoxyinosine 3'endonuclease (endonuclease V)
MIYCFDTYYFEDKAQTSCVGISSWESDKAEFELSETINEISAYESGAFYKRELPCITSILKQIDLNPTEDIIVIDGFVQLDDFGKKGLGSYLYTFLDSKIPIIGVAKNNFATINKLKQEIFRGESVKPLFITSEGIDLTLASNNIMQMHGNYRFPTILKLVDTHCRLI